MHKTRARRLLRDRGLADAPLVRAESYSNEVWVAPEHVVRVHLLGPPGRIAHEARVAACLPVEARYPAVVESGWLDGHDWMIQRRLTGRTLPAAWPGLSVTQRRTAIRDLASALRMIHRTTPPDSLPPCLFGGAPYVSRPQFVPELRSRLAWGAAALPAGGASVCTAALRLLEASAGAVADPPSALVHGDLNITNLMWDEGLQAVLDLEWARPEAADVDLFQLLGSCDDPVRVVPEDVEAVTRREDWIDVPRWLREDYPELFDAPRLRDRLTIYELSGATHGLDGSAAERSAAIAALEAVVDGRGLVARCDGMLPAV